LKRDRGTDIIDTGMGGMAVAVLVVFSAIFDGAPLFMKREKGERLMATMGGVLIPAAFIVGIGPFLLWIVIALAHDAFSL
jgi:hypothetical protein